MDEDTLDYALETTMDDAIEAFMKSDVDDENLSDDDEDEQAEVEEANEEAEDDAEEVDDDADPEDDDTDEDEDAEGDDEGEDEEGDDDDAPTLAEDAAEVVIEVDGKEVRATVAELKRLYGQEAALTTKSQSVAEQRRLVEAQGAYMATILQKRYEAAKANAEKYKNVDLFRASRELDADDFDTLREAKENAENELAALEREGQEFLQKSQETRQNLLREQAKESLKEVTKRIPEWNDELYTKIRTYAVAQGMDPAVVGEVIDPAAIDMMNKAMKYDALQSEKPKVKKKVTKAPKKVVRKSESKTDNKGSTIKAKRRAAVENGGDVDDIAELFMAASK